MSEIVTKSASKGKHKVSSGMDKTRRLHRAIRRANMKIVRWEKNQNNPHKNKTGKSRRGWNTEGLKKYVAHLQSLGGK